MLASRVIPILLYRGVELVKGTKFNSWRGIGSAAQAMGIYNRRKPDELIFLDVGATKEGRGPDFDLVAEVAGDFACPLTVGGGIRSLEDVKILLRSGADKVCIGTRLDLIPAIADAFGSQAVVASVDYRASECYTRSGSLSIGFNPVAVAKLASNDGVGEILLNCIDKDGTMEGYDLETLRDVSNALSVPVIACGGCSGYEDMGKAFEVGAAAVAAGALFAFTQATPKGAVNYLKAKGFHVRV